MKSMHVTMGVDHAWGTRGTSPPRIWSRGTLVQSVPLRILPYRYKKERYVAFKIRQIRFRLGLCPGTRWGSSRRSPRSLVGWRGDTPRHTPSYSAPTYPRRSPCVPLRIPGRSTPMHITICNTNTVRARTIQTCTTLTSSLWERE